MEGCDGGIAGTVCCNVPQVPLLYIVHVVIPVPGEVCDRPAVPHPSVLSGDSGEDGDITDTETVEVRSGSPGTTARHRTGHRGVSLHTCTCTTKIKNQTDKEYTVCYPKAHITGTPNIEVAGIGET